MRYNNNPLRTLARSHKWQALYSRSKDLKIQLFENTSDFSHIQSIFLQYLETYHNIFIDIYMKKEGIDEERVQDDILCYDKETEILTDQGWKYFKDLDKTEKVATLNPETDGIEYQKPISYIEYFHKGEMYHLKSSKVDLLVTPNHKHLIGTGSDVHSGNYQPKWILSSSEEIYSRYKCLLKRGGNWTGKKIKYHVLPEIEYNYNSDFINKYGTVGSYNRKFKFSKKVIKIKDWMEFLGWYLSEGGLYQRGSRSYATGIYQSPIANPEKYVAIEKLLKKLPFDFRKYKNHFLINNRQLAEHLASSCYQGAEIKRQSIYNCYNKRIPSYVKELNPEVIKILLTSYKKGDGWASSKNRFIITTSSNGMKDDLMELGLKAGFEITSRVKKNQTSYYAKENRYIVSKHDNWDIVFFDNKTNFFEFRSKNIAKINFEGLVYDVGVLKYHTLFVRRNGNTIWSGNCDAYLTYKKYKESTDKKAKKLKKNNTTIPSIIFKTKG